MKSMAKDGQTRRGFIKGAAIGTGTALLAGFAAKETHAVPLPRKWDREADVVVIGGGGAGLCASIEACKSGANTILLEKEPTTGGSSVISGGEFAFAPTAMQGEKGIHDSTDLFFNDLMKVGKGKNDPALVRAYVDASNDCYDFLKDMGVKFTDILIFPGFSVPRSHRANPAVVLKILKEEAVRRGTALLTGTAGKRLYLDPQGRIVGVKAATSAGKEFSIKARKAIVLATGGFGRNPEMLQEYSDLPLDLCVPVAAPGNTGDGHKMAMEMGAATKHISLGIGPGTGPSSPSDIKQTHLRPKPYYKGAVIVNKNGKRFVNESVSYTDLATAALKQPDALMISIADEPIYKAEETAGRVTTKKAETLEQLAEMSGLPPQVVVETINKYNGYVEAGKDPDFGRSTLVGISGKPVPIKAPPFYAFFTKPSIISTKGGIKATPQCQVINVFGEMIPRLYAAGEIMGGFHGAGYHTGSALGKALVFGRIAGKMAAGEKPLK